MSVLLALLIAVQPTVVVPSPPAGVGPYQEGGPAPPPPLVLNGVEAAMHDAFGAMWGVAMIKCENSDITRRIEAVNARFAALDPRLRAAVDRQRGGRIVRDAVGDLRNIYLPGCPPSPALEERISKFEKATDSLEATLNRSGY